MAPVFVFMSSSFLNQCLFTGNAYVAILAPMSSSSFLNRVQVCREVAGPEQDSVRARFNLVCLLAKGPRAMEGLNGLRHIIKDNFAKDIKMETVSRQKQALSTLASGFGDLIKKVSCP